MVNIEQSNQDYIGDRKASDNMPDFRYEKDCIHTKVKEQMEREKRYNSFVKVYSVIYEENSSLKVPEEEAIKLLEDWMNEYIGEYGEDKYIFYVKVKLGHLYHGNYNDRAIAYFESALKQGKKEEYEVDGNMWYKEIYDVLSGIYKEKYRYFKSKGEYVLQGVHPPYAEKIKNIWGNEDLAKIMNQIRGKETQDSIPILKQWIKEYLDEYIEDRYVFYARALLGSIYFELRNYKDAMIYLKDAQKIEIGSPVNEKDKAVHEKIVHLINIIDYDYQIREY